MAGLVTNRSQKKEECIPGDCSRFQVTDYAIFLPDDCFQLPARNSIDVYCTYQRKSVIPGDLSRNLNQTNRLYNLPMKRQEWPNMVQMEFNRW